jgi:hypothetical protein
MPVLRTKCLSTKVTDEDYAKFEALAGEQRVSAWARDVLLHAAASQSIELTILGELLAVRTIVLTCISPSPVATRRRWTRCNG